MGLAGVYQFEFEEMVEGIERYTAHPFLLTKQVRPSVSRFHFDVACAILQAAEVAPEKAKRILEAVLLLEQGLSIHDLVDEQTELNRQLLVLTGDYCSSRYYWILAHLNEEPLLMELCEAVVRINESKMAKLNFTPGVTPEKYMELQESVQGELLFALARHFLMEEAHWLPQIRSLVQGYVLKEALASKRAPKYFTWHQAYDWLTDSIDRVIHLQATAILQPITMFVMDYVTPIRTALENQAFAEGKH